MWTNAFYDNMSSLIWWNRILKLLEVSTVGHSHKRFSHLGWFQQKWSQLQFCADVLFYRLVSGEILTLSLPLTPFLLSEGPASQVLLGKLMALLLHDFIRWTLSLRYFRDRVIEMFVEMTEHQITDIACVDHEAGTVGDQRLSLIFWGRMDIFG